VEVGDTALDAAQRDAVAKAVHTPDVFLLQGLPGTGKSRVVAEIVAQAAARGERVLLVAPAAPAIDRVLGWVATREAACPVRCLDRDERAETLPTPIRALTFTERVRSLHEHAVRAARESAQARDQRCSRLRQDGAACELLAELAQRRHQLDEACA